MPKSVPMIQNLPTKNLPMVLLLKTMLQFIILLLILLLPLTSSLKTPLPLVYTTTRYLFPHKKAHLTATSAQSPHLTPPYHQPAHLTPPYHQPAHLTSLPTPPVPFVLRIIARKCLTTCATPRLNASRSLSRPAWRSPWRP